MIMIWRNDSLIIPCLLKAKIKLPGMLVLSSHSQSLENVLLSCVQFKYSPERKIHILDRLAWSEMFESFLANKFAAAKRFGLEVLPLWPHS